MTIYDKLNRNNIIDFMTENFDTTAYHDVWEAVRTLSTYGFQDMKKLFTVMTEYDSSLYENA